ncbi:hypothetical protein E1212_06060 [Jiangella ureilytica]|uniref:Uncharacterized protein n=1 Tax=Jiangella ureilytica TaxID=2530374 RepID=A0A4R4RX84_9ACTN|nr:hypothetical protein [Jiangella ureilytica]TDC53233.1 hypothetical protein E1212_06060 [Jiangella ureilytica]
MVADQSAERDAARTPVRRRTEGHEVEQVVAATTVSATPASTTTPPATRAADGDGDPGDDRQGPRR